MLTMKGVMSGLDVSLPNASKSHRSGEKRTYKTKERGWFSSNVFVCVCHFDLVFGEWRMGRHGDMPRRGVKEEGE